MNEVKISGKIGINNGLKTTKNGVSVLNFTLGHEHKKFTNWFTVILWGELAEGFRDLAPGTSVVIFGQLQSRPYTDKAGNKRKAVEIIAQYVNVDEVSVPRGARSPVASLDTQKRISSPQNARHEDVPFEDDIPY